MPFYDIIILLGRVAELVDALDSKSCGSNTVRVQVPPRPPENKKGPKALYLFSDRVRGAQNP